MGPVSWHVRQRLAQPWSKLLQPLPFLSFSLFFISFISFLLSAAAVTHESYESLFLFLSVHMASYPLYLILPCHLLLLNFHLKAPFISSYPCLISPPFLFLSNIPISHFTSPSLPPHSNFYFSLTSSPPALPPCFCYFLSPPLLCVPCALPEGSHWARWKAFQTEWQILFGWGVVIEHHRHWDLDSRHQLGVCMHWNSTGSAHMHTKPLCILILLSPQYLHFINIGKHLVYISFQGIFDFKDNVTWAIEREGSILL